MQTKTKVIENLAITTAKLANDSVSTVKIIANAVDGTKIRLANDQYLRGRNNADSGDINILKVNTSDEIETDGTWNFAVAPVSTNAPSSGDQLANKTYVDSVAGGAPRGYIFCSGHLGLGSTNTRVLRFATNNETLGSDAPTYSPSATLGDSFTITSDGIYTVNFGQSLSTSYGQMAITINGTALSTDPLSPITFAQGARAIGASAQASGGAGASYGFISWTGFLEVGDVVRFQATTGSYYNDNRNWCSLTKVAN